jgi:hypothetical protein
MIKKYWKFNLHLCQEQLRNVRVSQFSSCSKIAKSENAMLWRMLSRLETCIVYSCIWSVTLAKSIVPRKTWRKLWHSYISKLFLTKMQVKFKENFNFWHVHTLRSVFVNSPQPKPEVILTNFFAEPTVLLVPITSHFRFWLRRVHEDASQGMYMSKIEIFFFTARKLQNQRMLCCGECFHD